MPTMPTFIHSGCSNSLGREEVCSHGKRYVSAKAMMPVHVFARKVSVKRGSLSCSAPSERFSEGFQTLNMSVTKMAADHHSAARMMTRGSLPVEVAQGNHAARSPWASSSTTLVLVSSQSDSDSFVSLSELSPSTVTALGCSLFSSCLMPYSKIATPPRTKQVPSKTFFERCSPRNAMEMAATTSVLSFPTNCCNVAPSSRSTTPPMKFKHVAGMQVAMIIKTTFVSRAPQAS
mmetsp:Transcript_118261/g.329832  ORF Transcript_118261/g.329832 Transcript_118261/m.329832 type:complete len:233 (-) Transcript_118261:684-1382(-)